MDHMDGSWTIVMRCLTAAKVVQDTFLAVCFQEILLLRLGFRSKFSCVLKQVDSRSS